MATLESLPFDNSALRALPLDPEERDYVRTVHGEPAGGSGALERVGGAPSRAEYRPTSSRPRPLSGSVSSGACYSRVRPTPIKNPALVAHSQPALDLLSLSPSEVAREEFLQYLGGNELLPGSEPAAHCYCGHQFGSFSGQLGDGCAQWVAAHASRVPLL